MRLLATLIFACALLACGPTRPPRAPLRDDAYPGVLIDSAALPQGLFLRQRIEARFRDEKGGTQTLSFSAVLQSDDGVLSLLALTPYGTRAFLLEQRGQAVRFVAYVDRALPFPPRFVLVDVHRALFRSAREVTAAQPPDGTLDVTRDGERIREQWKAGKLIERSFERLDQKPKGIIRVRYGTGMPSDFPVSPLPRRIDLHNAWLGYDLAIHTLADGA